MAAALYRHFDRDGALLYVGATVNPFARQPAHRADSPWFYSVANITIEWLPSVAAVTEAERRAIEVERPRYNVSPGYCSTTEKRLAIAAEIEVPFVREFEPLYKSRTSAASALGITVAAMCRLIDAGEIGQVELSGRRIGVTGDQLVEYLRRLSSQHPWLPPARPTPRRRRLLDI